MPLRLPDKLPAIELLKHENIFVMDESRAHSQEIRPLRIVVLNLMPLKITTETDLVRLLSNTPLQIEVYFMKLKSHTPKNTPIEHMMMFYKDFAELSKQKFDGMIVTGAPIETMQYEDVEYWPEIQQIFDWARTHVTSTLYICWGAQAGLYHFYGVPKHPLSKKMFGIFRQKSLDDEVFGIGEVDDVVGIAGEHDDGLDFVTTHLIVEDFVRALLAELDEAVARDDDELFPLGVVPMLALGDTWLRDVDAHLSAVEGVDKFGERTAGIDVHLQVEDGLFLGKV